MIDTLRWRFPLFRPNDPDQILVEQARNGSQAAFSTLRKQHDPLLKGFVCRKVGSFLSEDVVQEIWIACWKALQQNVAVKIRFKSWLYGIAVHKCVDSLRSDKTPLTRVPDIENEPVQDDPYERILVKQSVQEAMLHLPESQRDILELYYYCDLTLKEIANTLDRNLNTVKFQFYRAHKQMAETLKTPEGGGNDL